MVASPISTNASALAAEAVRTAVTSNNIANSTTNGFKKSSVQFTSRSPDSGGGVDARPRLDADVPGVIFQTRNGTDIAISGDGFLLVSDSPDGTDNPSLSRAGSFQADGDGFLRNANGQFLLGQRLDADGNVASDALTPVNIASAGDGQSVEIPPDGTVAVTLEDGSLRPLFRIPVGIVSNPDGLAQESRTSFSLTSDSGSVNLASPGSAGAGELISGALESSNVNLEQELGQLILGRQAFAANAKAVAQNSQMTDKLLDIVR